MTTPAADPARDDAQDKPLDTLRATVTAQGISLATLETRWTIVAVIVAARDCAAGVAMASNPGTISSAADRAAGQRSKPSHLGRSTGGGSVAPARRFLMRALRTTAPTGWVTWPASAPDISGAAYPDGAGALSLTTISLAGTIAP